MRKKAANRVTGFALEMMSSSDSDGVDWYVYLLRCVDTSLYCGVTTDLKKRLRQHNGEIKGGAKYTQTRRPCTLVYQESHASRSAASQREYVIKQLSKAAKEALVTRSSSKVL